MFAPLRFAFGVHLHQPVGNFGYVFEQHVREVYQPFLDRAEAAGFFPLVMHVSGPLLEWLEVHEPGYLDTLGRLVENGKVELLLSGYYEPVLAALPREDRLEQVRWMREALERRFGYTATGLWLTERVWEPELAADLADAGVRYVLVDDRHFLVTGFRRDQLHQPWTTESDGRKIAVVPIDERLRYLVPFRPPEETAAYLRELRAAGHGLAVLADDGEKFGGWPGTREWVYEKGWLDRFMHCIGELIAGGEVVLCTLGDALARVPSAGLAYLPTASYREMEGWALPPAAAQRLGALERDLGEARMQGEDGALIRGAHWRNFLVKYSEANRMHKKMQAVSRMCRLAGEPADARRAIGRAQCNDAYWHGVFGGLYLPFLRAAVWGQLALAEGILRAEQPLAYEIVDLDADGHDEIWVHSHSFSCLLSPRRGGALEEFTRFDDGVNYADVLTRRREACHEISPAGGTVKHDDGGTASIHDLESATRPDELPPVDPGERPMLIERILPGEVDGSRYARGDYTPVWTPAMSTVRFEVREGEGTLRLTFRILRDGVEILEKQFRFTAAGTLHVEYRWHPGAFPVGAWFVPELSLSAPLEVLCTPAAEAWTYDITTVAKSERGLDETLQGRAIAPRWPVDIGAASFELGRPLGR
jgi:alpha-amylase